jgi:hypothetical protein
MKQLIAITSILFFISSGFLINQNIGPGELDQLRYTILHQNELDGRIEDKLEQKLQPGIYFIRITNKNNSVLTKNIITK